MLTKIICNMARAFRCKSCGTRYSTTSNDVPPSPKWADGHICKMIEVESNIKAILNGR